MLVAVVGKTAVGKTTVLNYLHKQFNYTVFSADKFVHEQYEKGQKGYDIIATNFGSAYVNKNRVDRVKLAQLVFHNSQALEKLSQLTKPLIQQWIVTLKQQFKSQTALVEIAVMLNYWNDYEPLFDQVIQIKRPWYLVKASLQTRGYDIKILKNLIKNPNFKIEIVQNNSTVEICALKLIKLLKKFSKSNKSHHYCDHNHK